MNSQTNIEAILTTYTPLLCRIAASYESDPRLQEDLIQDISLSLWRSLESFEQKSSLKTYIARIAHNRCVDHVLKEQRHNKGLIDGFDETDIPHAPSNIAQEESMDLLSAIQRLSISHKQVISMQLEGFTQSEIASVLGINEASVAKRASRARQLLEQWLRK